MIDGAEHVRAGAERKAEVHVPKVMFDAFAERAEGATHDLEFARRGALKREDRLLFVADREIVRLTARAPAPAKNSAVSRRMISHCFGLVSCASSISTWSMPRSSL